MVVLELALTLVLLVGAGLMVRSFLKLYTLDIGIKHRQPDGDGHAAARSRSTRRRSARRAFYERLRAAGSRRFPAPTSRVAHDERAAVRRRPRGRSRSKDGRRASRTMRAPEVGGRHRSARSSSTTVGVQLRRGRAFTDTDGAPGAENIIVNEQFATAVLPRRGSRSGGAFASRSRRRRPGNRAPPVQSWRTIVGISPTIRHTQPQDAEPPAVIYRAVPPGSAGRRDAAGAQPARRRRDHERRAPGSAGRRRRPAGLHDPDDGPDDDAADLAVPGVRQPVRDLRGHRAGACRRSVSTR